MKALVAVSGLVSLGLVVACGGAEKPAAAPSDSSLVDSPPGGKGQSAATEQKGEPPSAELSTGIKAFDAGKFADAQASFQAALTKNPKDVEAAFNLGLVDEKLGDSKGAVKAYRLALGQRPELEPASVALSSVLVDQGDFDGAVLVCRKGLDAHPNSAPLHENLGVALASKGDVTEARAALEAGAAGPKPSAQSLLTLGHWLAQWKVPDAKGTLVRAATAGGDDIGVLAAAGLELRLAGAFQECVTVFDRAVGLKDGGEVRTERALCKLGLKDDAGALSDLTKAVTTEASFAPGHYYLAGRLASSGKLAEAVPEYEAYLKLAPEGSLAKAARERLTMAKAAAKGKR